MSWLTEMQDPSTLRERAAQSLTKSVTLPLGLVNPLWLAFGAAASAGAAWWMMTRWTRPVNVEAVAAAPIPAAAVEAPAVVEAEIPKVVPVVVEAAPVEAPAAVVEPIVEAVVEPIIEAVAPEPDDLTRLVGVGPRSAAALAERGVTSFAALAAWTTEELAAFDAELKLKGRSVRDAWQAQAKTLAAKV